MNSLGQMLPLIGMLAIVGCATTVVISGADLAEAERAELKAARGVEITMINGAEVDGDVFVMAPGTYSVDFATRTNLSIVNPLLSTVKHLGLCHVKIDLDAAERAHLQAVEKVGKPKMVGSYEQSEFHTEILLVSSNEAKSKGEESFRCEFQYDCRRINRSRVRPPPECGSLE